MENIKDIVLKSTNYAEENAAFLATYDTDDKQIDYYTELACKLFDEFEIDGTYTVDGVRKNVAAWFENKKKQMELFRKHSYWNEEAKAIVFSQTETRPIDYKRASNALCDLAQYVRNRINVNGDKWCIDAIIYALECYRGEETGLLNEDTINNIRNSWDWRYELPTSLERMFHNGTKITKFVRKAFEEVQDRYTGEIKNATTLRDDGDDPRACQSFDKYYAKFADCLSELTIEKITLVSLNFLDFMTMSNGNSWSSCHFINSHGIFHEDSESSYQGMYKQGCLSYALDEPSFILYTLPASYNGKEYYRRQKLTRMCCQYSNGVLITGKCYPNNEDALVDRYRQMMQLIISQTENFTNLWTFSRKVKRIEGFVETADNSGHYPDYFYDHQKPVISLHNPISIDVDNPIVVGHEAYCLHCGEKLYGRDHSWLQCDFHRRTLKCNCCGKRMHMHDDYYVIENNFYCPDCVFWCDYHQKYEPMDWKYGELTTNEGTKIMCYDATRHFMKCDDCGVWYPKSMIITKRVGSFCSHCIEKYDICSICGEIITKGKVRVKRDGDKVCERCHDLSKYGIKVTAQKSYKAGDYVVMMPTIEPHHVGVIGPMRRYYPNRIVKISEAFINYGHKCYYISPLDGDIWSWDHEHIAGRLKNADDSWIGKTIDEVLEMYGKDE